MNRIATVWTTALFATACTVADVRPSDMSAVAHENIAKRDDTLAREQMGAYDADAETAFEHCSPSGRLEGALYEPCWSSFSNPTEGHLREARYLRKLADQHRAAAATLRTAETTSCSGISRRDRDISPFTHGEDVLSTVVKTDGSRVTGVSVLMKAVPGMTAAYLSKMIDCHLARNAAMGFDLPELAFDPLAVKGAHGTVEMFNGDLRITLTADDDAATNELAKRATALTSRADLDPLKN